MQIKITVRQVYGETKTYPACEHAKTFAAIAGTKTLTPHTLRHIKSLGYELVIDADKTIAAHLT